MVDELIEGLPNEEEIERDVAMAGELAGVKPLDPDFIAFAVPFAITVDVFDIVIFILGFLDIFTISSGVSIAIDIFVLFILGSWIYWRTQRIAESKKNRRAAVEKNLQQALKKMEHLQKIGRVSPETFERYLQMHNKRLGSLGKFGARLARKASSRFLIRVGITLLGEAVIFIGIIPFWTIGVFLMLKEK